MHNEGTAAQEATFKLATLLRDRGYARLADDIAMVAQVHARDSLPMVLHSDIVKGDDDFAKAILRAYSNPRATLEQMVNEARDAYRHLA